VLRALGTLLLLAVTLTAGAFDRRDIDAAIRAHPDQTGALVLDHGEHSLLVRAWLADNARRSIDVQYFIWSVDNIGTLAAESLLRAADRGVQVRVIVDDLLLDAPERTLVALALHPRIDIRVYNPMHSVGVPWYKRLWGVLRRFRDSNQRMHDKTVIVDGELAITGGRNMADEYYDYDHAYNFRDRDALVIGRAAASVQASFERFWTSTHTVPLERQLPAKVLRRYQAGTERDEVYSALRAHAADPANFAPEVRGAIASIPESFPRLAQQLSWGRVDFLSDLPGKNDGRSGLGGGGLSTAALAALVRSAQREVLIQSPYLVLSEPAKALFRETLARGVSIRISTNSLASTDNLQAFSGYSRQRRELLKMGLAIGEYRPDPAVQRELMDRYAALREQSPVFALHAKTLVMDRERVFIGTYNLDPRSENLNTEVGVVIHDAQQAGLVARAIETDLAPENSWNPAREDPDGHAPRTKRLKVAFWKLLPLKPLL
jgi:putative cardiolipin synthase